MMKESLSNSLQEQGSNMLISKYFGRAALGAAALVMMTVSAAAQSKVLVVDSQRIVAESEVGKHVKRQIEAISKTMSTELKSAASPLQSSGQSLNAELQGKTPAEQKAAIQNDAGACADAAPSILRIPVSHHRSGGYPSPLLWTDSLRSFWCVRRIHPSRAFLLSTPCCSIHFECPWFPMLQ
mgnify:CR=1 FL=1